MSVAIVVHVPVPAGERWKTAEAMPEPESLELEDTLTAAPETLDPDEGAVSDPVGAVLSTRTLTTVGDVELLPTLSEVTTRRS